MIVCLLGSQVIYDKSSDKHWGYVDLGEIPIDNTNKIATEVLVFLIVSYTNKFKCPIAYFFINNITAVLQSELITCALEKLFEVGVTVRSLTCDGTITNIKTFENLGCNFSTENMLTYFRHPSCDIRVHCIIDACHLQKLYRNAFAEISLFSPKGQILFDFIKELNELQEKENLKMATSLSNMHVNFFKKKDECCFGCSNT